MAPDRTDKPRVFVDADVLFAGSASPSENSASLVVLRMSEITLIEGVTSEQVIIEAERSLSEKIPKALPAFHLLVSRSLRVVPIPKKEDLLPYTGAADPADLPILVAAIRENCPWLTTFNVRHYQPGHPSVSVLKPGDLILRVRYLLATLSREEGKNENID
jgi:hypothetical protein